MTTSVPTVDTHVHVMVANDSRYPLNPTGATDDWFLQQRFDANDLAEAMPAAGVDRAVVVQAVNAYQFDNRYVLAATRDSKTLTSVGAIDLRSGDPVATLRTLVNDGGMRGLRWWAIPSGIRFVRDARGAHHAVGESAPGLVREPMAVWEAAVELQIPVTIAMLPSQIPELVAVLRALPSIPIALDHCAMVSFSTPVPADLQLVAPLENVALKVSSAVLDELARLGDPAVALRELASRFGADRLMWASNYPATHDRSYGDLAEYGRGCTARLSTSARDAFLGGTAIRYWPELQGDGRPSA
jgi:L-fuconolactonase